MNEVSVYNTKATEISGVTFLIMHSVSNVMIIEYDNSSHVAIDKWDAFKCFEYYVWQLFWSFLNYYAIFLNESQCHHKIIKARTTFSYWTKKMRSFISWHILNSFHNIGVFSLSYSAMYCIWKLFLSFFRNQ